MNFERTTDDLSRFRQVEFATFQELRININHKITLLKVQELCNIHKLCITDSPDFKCDGNLYGVGYYSSD
jgi:hypothetical protein